MPVWHEAMAERVEAGELVLVGIAQEQHPERCRLFAQWKELDFPILWDPFGLTGSSAVPSFVGVDEHGVVRTARPRLERFAEEFLERDFEAPEAAPALPPSALAEGICAFPEAHGQSSPIADLMRGERVDAAVELLEVRARDRPQDAELAFRAGVARRLRFDSPLHRPDDFQAALDHWGRALALEPGRYVWRRRIQQYGPRMDKPYPFYAWVDEARRAIAERGGAPVELVSTLTPAELAEPRDPRARTDEAEPVEPDPEDGVPRDEAGLVAVESAVAFDTEEARTASLHLTLRPDAAREAHWNHEAGPPVEVWLGGPAPRRLAVPPREDVAVSREVHTLHAEVTLPEGTDELVVPGYALYSVCEGAGGTCLYLRRDFEVLVRRPR